MRQLRISIERAGRQIPVGRITGNTPEDACFTYDIEYLKGRDAVPISIMLPLQTGAFDPGRTKRYFDGLLPEGFMRRCVAQWLQEEEVVRAGLGLRMAMRRFDRLAEGFEKALQDAADELMQLGFPGAMGMRARILERGGYRNL